MPINNDTSNESESARPLVDNALRKFGQPARHCREVMVRDILQPSIIESMPDAKSALTESETKDQTDFSERELVRSVLGAPQKDSNAPEKFEYSNEEKEVIEWIRRKMALGEW